MLWEGVWNMEDQLMYCTGRDITERRLLQQLEQTYQEELRRTIEHLERITDGFAGLDQEGRITYWNQAAEGLFQLSRQEVLGHVWWDLMFEPARGIFLTYYTAVKAKNEPATFELYSERINSWLEVSIYVSGSGLSVYFRNITGKKKLEEQLQHERDLQQKRITAAVIKATEEERAQVGKELHDNVNQVLTTVKLYNELCISGQGPTRALLEKSNQLLQDSINEIRALSKRLSAPALGNILLKDSIGELVEAINSTQKLMVVYENDIEELDVSEEVHVAVYRILQEQFTNILKHANATTARLSLALEDQAHKVVVHDNGKGFDPAMLRRGIGIENMISRTQGLNGNLSLTSTPGKGCLLEFSIPLEHGD